MIRYNSDLFGIKALFVWHGSAVFRAFLPASFSTGMLILSHYYLEEETVKDRGVVSHPYVISAYVLVLGYMVVFRLNYSYQRYWEAATQIHQMTSKWLDSAICLAAFHMQSSQYDNQRPPSFGSNQHHILRNETRERERLKNEKKLRDDTISICTQQSSSSSPKKVGVNWRFKRKQKKNSKDRNKRNVGKRFQTNNISGNIPDDPYLYNLESNWDWSPQQQAPSSSSSRSSMKAWKASFASSRFSTNDFQDQRRLKRLTGLDSSTPSLFLQEAAHLYSLLSAVAMSTLRRDLEGVEAPLASYVPGLPFPPTNPDELSPEIREQFYVATPVLNFIYYALGIKKSREQRTLYNAARPFRVIGGISDKESTLLQKARGPKAEMALCNMWLKEFISREHLNGSTGKVAPPILGRVYQFLSDGVAGYNHCFKIAFVPFPFPHAQATTFFIFVSLFIFPLLYVGYVNNLLLACFLNYTTVLCFSGAHEVSRELSDPYYTVPNDIPLNSFQTHFNEALISMWAGFHPDSWRVDKNLEYSDDLIPDATQNHTDQKVYEV